MPAIADLNDLFADMLKDIYYAEKKILKSLPKLAKAVKKDTPELAEAYEKHYEETEGQIERLEQVFDMIGKKAVGKKCAAIEGILEEGEELMKNTECKHTLAAGLLAGGQAVEHYEMARYGALVEWAKLLGYEEVAELLQETLEQEENTDKTLSELARDGINQQAIDAMSEEGEEQDEGDDESSRKSSFRAA